jgi:hypothetical protein
VELSPQSYLSHSIPPPPFNPLSLARTGLALELAEEVHELGLGRGGVLPAGAEVEAAEDEIHQLRPEVLRFEPLHAHAGKEIRATCCGAWLGERERGCLAWRERERVRGLARERGCLAWREREREGAWLGERERERVLGLARERERVLGLAWREREGAWLGEREREREGAWLGVPGHTAPSTRTGSKGLSTGYRGASTGDEREREREREKGAWAHRLVTRERERMAHGRIDW